MVGFIDGEHRLGRKKGWCIGGRGDVAPKGTVDGTGTGFHGNVAMLFEHLYRLSHARDYPCLLISEGRWERHDGAQGAYLGQQGKRICKQVSVIPAEEAEHILP